MPLENTLEEPMAAWNSTSSKHNLVFTVDQTGSNGVAVAYSYADVDLRSYLNQWVHVTVQEGRNRLVRRLFDSQNCTVSRLMRIRYGNIVLPSGLRRGYFEELTPEEIKRLEEVA